MATREGEKLPTIEIVNGVPRLMRCSPSQVKTFRSCGQKWVGDKVHKWPRKPEGVGQRIGGEGHNQIEHYLKTGEDVRGDLARMSDLHLRPFMALMPFSDATASHGRAMIECPLPPLFTPGGVQMIGFADLIVPPGHDLKLTNFDPVNIPIADGAVFDASRYPVVVDHKFRSNVEKYADTPQALEFDEQAIIYGKAALTLWRSELVLFRHHNHQYKGRRFSNAITCVLGSDQVELAWSALCALIDGPMQEAARTQGKQGAAFNEGACSAYGGCDFEKQCPKSPRNRFVASIRSVASDPDSANPKVEPIMTSIADRLKAQLAGTPQTAPQPQTQTAPQPQPQPQTAPQPPSFAPPPDALPLFEARNAKPGDLYMVEGGFLVKCEGVLPSGVFFSNAEGQPKMLPLNAPVRDMTSDPVVRGNFKLPPLTPAQTQPAPGSTHDQAFAAAAARMAHQPGVVVPGITGVTPPDMPAHSPAPAQTQTAPAQTQAAPAQTQTAPAQTQAAPETPATQPARRGRPPKKKHEGAQVPQNAGAGAVLDSEGLVLLINCNAQGAQDLAPFVLGIAQKVAQAHGLPDVRLAPNDHNLAYGRWKGIVASAALAEPPQGLCSIRSGELADPIIEALAGVADLVIR